MQDFEKIEVVKALISGEQTKEAFIAPALKGLTGLAFRGGKWAVKNPLASLGAAANTYFVGDAAMSGARAAAKAPKMPLPRNTMATF